MCYNIIWLGTFRDMCFVYGALQDDITMKFVINSLKNTWWLVIYCALCFVYVLTGLKSMCQAVSSTLYFRLAKLHIGSSCHLCTYSAQGGL